MIAFSPSRKWYLLCPGLVVLAYGVHAMAVWSLVSAGRREFRPEGLLMPGRHEVTLRRSCPYRLYLLQNWAVDGAVHRGVTDANGLAFRMVSLEDGREVDVYDPKIGLRFGSESGDSSQPSGRVLFHFDVPRAGRYVLTGEYVDGRDGPTAVVGLEKDMNWITGRFFLGTAVLWVLTIPAVIVIAVVIARKRRRNRLAALVIAAGGKPIS